MSAFRDLGHAQAVDGLYCPRCGLSESTFRNELHSLVRCDDALRVIRDYLKFEQAKAIRERGIHGLET